MGLSLQKRLRYYVLQLFFLISCCLLTFSSAIDTIKANESLSNSEALISKGNKFKLSFFNPPNSSRHYVGIMYNLPVTSVVWVANRDRALNDSSGTFKISSDGNLVILDGRKEIVWSTNFSSSVANYSAVLLDTGNLVLQDNSSNAYVWESFQHASDSFLPKMRLFVDVNRKEKNILTSWTSPDDPTPGRFTMTIEPNIPQSYVFKDGTKPCFRTGPWNGQRFIGLPGMRSLYNDGTNVGSDSPGTAYYVFTVQNSSVLQYYVLNSSGIIEEREWSDEKKGWDVTWRSDNECDIYGKCGSFGSCDAQDSPICTCFRGFVPRSKDEWEAGNWTSGCTRRSPLKCEHNNSLGKEDEFLKMEGVKLPDHYILFPVVGDCRGACLSDCSCIAYADVSGIGCMHWIHNLTDNQKFAYGGEDLYVRLAYSELHEKQDRRAIIATTVVLGFILIAVCTYFMPKILSNYRARKHDNKLISSQTKENGKHGVELEELPIVRFEMLSDATEKFDPANMLGEGGFGPVYKGQLPNGQEIAVKRLARSSNQGVEEFTNEVVVISRLQHRNLVRLIGCCVEYEEKMLVYEYMPNGSLDACLFGSHKREFLNWQTRKVIIEGICRGLLYLHRDSRLKIIHRDLKASNILLDEELNPKISDFGMARIFGGKDDQANTTRVVGTFGYMSPEYAHRGIFSEKSDVYSFGVLLIEIVSGKKNSSFYDEDQQLFLTAYAWKLWNEGRIIKLIDPAIYDSGMEDDIVRYGNVGLLCVQEMAADRPNASTVLSMLSCEIVELPHPKQPAFLGMQSFQSTQSSTKSSTKCSVNDVTISILGGRDPEVLISDGNRFKLSFFSPPNNNRRYLGVMYNLPVMSVVWVANRNKALNDSLGTFQISSDGNLVILDGRKEIVWSTNLLISVVNTRAVLLDTGNLVLQDDSNNVSVWESFQHASDSWLEEMKIVPDLSRKEKNLLTSWKSPDDPAPRSFTFTIEPLDIPQSFIWKDGNPNWRTGPWNRQKYTGVPNMSSDYGYGVKVVSDSPGTVYQILNFTNSSVALYFLLNSSGSLEAKRWSDEKKGWDTTWPSTSNECERYGKCGPFGSCDAQHRPICSCFRGFRPRSEDEWDAGNWTSGCTRKTPLQCEQNNSVGKQDKFLKLEGVKLPNHFKYRLSEGGCRDKCLSSCSCIAYAVPPGIGCLHWTHNLTDNHKCTYGGDDLYIRLAHSELDNKQHHRTIIVTIAVLGFQFISFDILYKGKFPNGVEIAVKRLARSSNQGVDEFMNEVEVISRLQHRNLVRLLGCCVEIEEKLLVYEYMPNGSLDAYLFGSLRNKLLNWQRRKLIIEGICRGLLYLHRDSRLKIIHRDLKSSNILLDEVFKPKISDFGMARIFGGKDDQASTTRVVGTFGYMPPEYALREIFSEKSDVYSFGVLLLEIVSGKKNSSFYDQQLFLTAYAWKLWNEGKIVNLMDPTIHDSGLEDDTVRYANVGLLCVQEMAADRPNASTVLSMLSCEIVELPHPKQPAFLGMQSSQATESATKVSSKFSTSDMTISVVEGR